MLFSLCLRVFLIPSLLQGTSTLSHSIIISIQAEVKAVVFPAWYKHLIWTCFYISAEVFLGNKNFVPTHTTKMMQTSNEQISLQELLIYVNVNICRIYLFITSFELDMNTVFTACLLSVISFTQQTLLGLFFLYIFLTTAVIILFLKTSFWDSRSQ